MGLLDLLAWSKASEASDNAKDAIEKLNALEQKIDLIAERLDSLEAFLKVQR